MGNGLIDLDVSASGLLALRDRDGREQLSSPLQLERYRDRGEFWDAWDLASDYRSQPLGVVSADSLEWLDQGPLVAPARCQPNAAGPAAQGRHAMAGADLQH